MSKTSKGLIGYWSHFTPENTPLPPHSVTTRCVAGQRNQVWIDVWISQGIGVPAKAYGLFLTDGTDWFEYKLGERGLPVTAVQHPVMATDNAGRLWALMYDFGLCCFDGQSTMAYEYGQPGFLTRDVWINDVCVDKLNRVWLATMSQGLYTLLPNGTWEDVVLKGDIGFCDQILALSIDWTDNLWIACSDMKETRFLAKRLETWELVCRLPLGTRDADLVRCFAVDRNNNIWVGRQVGGLMLWNGKSWQILTEKDCSILYGDIQSITVDEYNNVWVGLGGGSLAVFDGAEWHSWVAVQPESKQPPVGKEELLRAGFGPETGHVRIGGYVAIDTTGRKWIPALTGVVMFSPGL